MAAMSVLPSATLSTARAITSWKFRTVQTNDVKPIEDWRESITPTLPALRWSHRLFEVARCLLLRQRRPVSARRFAVWAMINHQSARLTTMTHATRRALCVARTRGTCCRSRLGAAGSLPAGGGGGGGCLAAAGGGWGQLAARGEGSGGGGGGVTLFEYRYFFSETIYFLVRRWWAAGALCERQRVSWSPTRKKMVTCFPPLQPACRLRACCAADAQRMRSGCAADAQRMRSGCAADAQRMRSGFAVQRMHSGCGG
jgi:hypothetical protein